MNIRNRLTPKIIFPLILVAIEIVLFVANYKPGTYLIGWDNVMPEFDIKTNFIRSFYSIWQEYRGLGVTDGMSHAANLFHTIYVWLLSLFLPQSVLRYAFIHITHILGGIGFFYLSLKLTKNNIASFLGSLFYMFNIGVMQMYFAPLEVFATHFAALPILALAITNALDRFNRKNLLILFLEFLFLYQQAFVPTVFMAFSILFIFFLVAAIAKHGFKKPIIVFLIAFLANAFWGLPYIYSAMHTGATIKESRINEFSSEEIFLRNKTFGDAPSVLSLKGFMLDTVELDPKNYRDTYFMGAWKKLNNTLAYNVVYLLLGIIAVFGLIWSLIKRRFELIPYILTAGVSFVFLANDTPIFSNINELIRRVFPLLGEAFRFPFTKFVTIFAFCISILLSFGLSLILTRIKWQKIALVLGILALTIISYPAIQGNFTSPFLKQKLPDDYIHLFSYMKSQPQAGRVALFPVDSYWNWQYRSWGQRGSGFIWHGFPQPILERAFDPWSPYDEQFYNEISYAVSTQDENLFENVIKKYDISYIVLDKYVLNTLGKRQINYDSLENFLAKSGILSKSETFNRVIVYKTKIKNGWIYQLDKDNTKSVFPNYSFEKQDNIFNLTDNYIVDGKSADVVNLFPSLYSQKTQEDLEFKVKNNKSEYVLTPKKQISADLSKYTLSIPSLFNTEFLVPVKVSFAGNSLILTPDYPKIVIDGQVINLDEEPIVLASQTLNQITSAIFLDINHETKSNDKDPYSYVLNSAINSVSLKDSEGNEETVYLDTSSIQRKSFNVSLSNKKIKNVKIVLAKHNTSQSINNVLSSSKINLSNSNEGPFSNSYSNSSARRINGAIDLTSVNGSSDMSFYSSDLFHSASYIVLAKSTFVSGLPIKFYLDNPTEEISVVESLFSKNISDSTIVIPRSNNYFKGYGFHFGVKSVGKEKAKSLISNIEVYPFPVNFIRNLAFTAFNPDQAVGRNPKVALDYRRINGAAYETYAKPNEIIALSQAYDSGWRAYEVKDTNSSILSIIFPFPSGKQLKNHVLVDNWANGWITENGGRISIIYFPQYLQYLGIGTSLLSLIGLGFLALKRRKKNYFLVDEGSNL